MGGTAGDSTVSTYQSRVNIITRAIRSQLRLKTREHNLIAVLSDGSSLNSGLVGRVFKRG